MLTCCETRKGAIYGIANPDVPSFFPGLVGTSSTPYLTPFQEAHVPPFWYIGSIDVPAGLYTDPTSGTSCTRTIDSGNVNESAGVELKSWLSAVHFEMETSRRVREGDKLPQRSRPRVQRYGGRIRVHDKAIIRIWFFCTKNEGLFWLHVFIWLYVAQRYPSLVDWEVLICSKSDLGTFNRRTAAESEVAMCSLLVDPRLKSR